MTMTGKKEKDSAAARGDLNMSEELIHVVQPYVADAEKSQMCMNLHPQILRTMSG